jgi:hypothetical protein
MYSEKKATRRKDIATEESTAVGELQEQSEILSKKMRR